MLNDIKKTQEQILGDDSGKVWFTADTHFGHANIIRYSKRPWMTPEDLDTEGNWKDKSIARKRKMEMNKALIDNWNNVVGPNDIVYHLGDFSFGTGAEALDILRCLHFQELNFIWGNHDKAMQEVFSMSGAWNYNSFVLDKLKFLGYLEEIKVENQLITLCHYAMKTWNKSHHNAWHLYWHSHGTLPDDPNSLSFDVGVDCHHYRPISFQEVACIMSKKTFKPIDHHGLPK